MAAKQQQSLQYNLEQDRNFNTALTLWHKASGFHFCTMYYYLRDLISECKSYGNKNQEKKKTEVNNKLLGEIKKDQYSLGCVVWLKVCINSLGLTAFNRLRCHSGVTTRLCLLVPHGRTRSNEIK